MSHYVSTDKFTYNKDSMTFITEHSTLGPRFTLAKIYPDSIDLGFIMVSYVTGKELAFVHYHTEIKDGEIVSWKFKLAGPVPKPLSNIEAIIFND